MTDDPTRPTSCAPAFQVSDLGASLDFYEHALGFEVAFRWGQPAFYAGVCRGEVAIHLSSAEREGRVVGASILCLFVGDADAVHRELVERGVAIAAAIDDRPYGLRDFSVKDPDGNELVFGSELEGGSP